MSNHCNYPHILTVGVTSAQLNLPRLKNMYRTMALFLLILNGWPLRTILFMIILSGSTERSEPLATSWWPPAVSLYMRTGQGGKVMGAYVLATQTLFCGIHLSYWKKKIRKCYKRFQKNPHFTKDVFPNLPVLRSILCIISSLQYTYHTWTKYWKPPYP